VALGLGLIWLAIAPRTADLAAQFYRAGLFHQEGFALWDNAWFGGHHIPGYSLLFPWLANLIGVWAVGLLAVLASAVLFADLARRHIVRHRRWAVAWFVAAAVGDLYIGRVTYALGVTLALACLAALSRRRYALAIPFAVATTAASPVAGLFLGLVVVTVWPRLQRGKRLYLAAAIGTSVAAMSLMFPEGGQQPYDLVPALLALGIVVAVRLQLAPSERLLSRGVSLYAITIVASYVLPTPMGSNVTRLGVLAAGPLFIAASRRSSRRLALLTCAVLVAWQGWGPLTEVQKAGSTTANQQAYFAPLLRELDRRGASTGRVEVVPTTTRWESVYVARRFTLARGWETQLDRSYNSLFYKDTLRPAAYHRWLRQTGVRFVAVPSAPKERWGKTEAALIASGVSFLRPVWSDANWHLYAVRDARGLAGPGQTVTMRPEGFVLTSPRGGVTTVRVRWSKYWTIVPSGCVSRAPDGFTQLRLPAAGSYVVKAGWSVEAAFGDSGGCFAGSKPANGG
jgi:hypothetical protein